MTIHTINIDMTAQGTVQGSVPWAVFKVERKVTAKEVFVLEIENLFFETIAGNILQIVPIMISAGIIYICGYYFVSKYKETPKKNFLFIFARFMFVCYFSGIIALTLTPPNFWSALWYWIFYGVFYIELSLEKILSLSFNYIPSVYCYLAGELTGGTWIKAMIIGNVLMFVPMGLLLPFILKKNRFFEVVRFGVTTILAIEIIQPFIGRSFDIDDILCNTMGVMVGFLCFFIVRKIAPSFVDKCREGMKEAR